MCQRQLRGSGVPGAVLLCGGGCGVGAPCGLWGWGGERGGQGAACGRVSSGSGFCVGQGKGWGDSPTPPLPLVLLEEQGVPVAATLGLGKHRPCCWGVGLHCHPHPGHRVMRRGGLSEDRGHPLCCGAEGASWQLKLSQQLGLALVWRCGVWWGSLPLTRGDMGTIVGSGQSVWSPSNVQAVCLALSPIR